MRIPAKDLEKEMIIKVSSKLMPNEAMIEDITILPSPNGDVALIKAKMSKGAFVGTGTFVLNGNERVDYKRKGGKIKDFFQKLWDFLDFTR